MKDKLINWSTIGVFAFIVMVMAYFIVHNAQWLIGDDALIIRSIGWGHFFPSDILVNPESGRFAPLVGMHINVLPLISHGYTSPVVVYVYQAFWFLILALLSFWLVYNIIKNVVPEANIWHYPISLLCSIFILCRYYPEFINCYIGSWFWGGTMTAAIMLFSILFYQKKKNIYAIIAMILVVYTTYCSEFFFAAPLAWGVCASLIWTKSTRAEKIFHIGLIINAIIYLSLYAILILPNVASSYDSSHGSEMTMLCNALHIIIAQKFLWVVGAVFLVRAYEILVKKEEYTIYDVFILTALAHCCAGFILKLNWALYYNRAIVIALPAVIWWMSKKCHPAYLCGLMLCFLGLYGMKVPKVIKENQKARTETWQLMNTVIETEQKTMLPIIMYSLAEQDNTYNGDLIQWYFACMQSYIAWMKNDESLIIPRVATIMESGIYITWGKNEEVIEGANDVFKEQGVLVASWGDVTAWKMIL